MPLTGSHRESTYLISVNILLHLTIQIKHTCEYILHLLILSWRERNYSVRYRTLGGSQSLGEGSHVTLLRLFGFRNVGAHIFGIQPWPQFVISRSYP